VRSSASSTPIDRRIFPLKRRPGIDRVLTLGVVLLLSAGCIKEAEEAAPEADAAVPEGGPRAAPNHVAGILAAEGIAFGMFSGDRTAAQGTVMGREQGVDFVFYDLEVDTFDMGLMEQYLRGMQEAAPDGSGALGAPPILLRIPPVRKLGREAAQDYVRRGLAAGARGIVFPHVMAPEDAVAAADLVGDDLWPRRPEGALISVVIIEDHEAVDRAREIAAADGVAVVLLGPNDMLTSYQGDAAAVERGIQTVLSACKEVGVACGITATAADIGKRIDEGFRFLLVREPEALAAGLTRAGRR
jgi:2-keto-3-deoxy-L-rhamnonate aldolase RhmA